MIRFIHKFYRWRVNPVGACSATCGHGERRQESECIRSYVDGREELIQETECNHLKKPNSRSTCFVDCSGRQWTYTEWLPVSQISVSNYIT